MSIHKQKRKKKIQQRCFFVAPAAIKKAFVRTGNKFPSNKWLIYFAFMHIMEPSSASLSQVYYRVVSYPVYLAKWRTV